MDEVGPVMVPKRGFPTEKRKIFMGLNRKGKVAKRILRKGFRSFGVFGTKDLLHQRSKQPQKSRQQPLAPGLCIQLSLSNQAALANSIQNVFPNLIHNRRMEKGHRTFIMKVKAAIIKVGSAYHRHIVVADEHLGMNETGHIFVDFHPRPDQGRV